MARWISALRTHQPLVERVRYVKHRTIIAGVRRGMVVSAVTAALAVTACTGTSHRRPTAHVSPPLTSTPSSGPIYRVVTDVETAPDGVSVLCGPMETTSGGGPTSHGRSLPCGRIQVIGMPTGLPGSRNLGGYIRTPALLLSGHWHAGPLTLTSTPRRTKMFWQVTPACAADPGPGVVRPDRRLPGRIANDRFALRAAGTDVYEISTCGSVIVVLVPVADAATKSLFKARYGPSVQLFGWLRTT